MNKIQRNRIKKELFLLITNFTASVIIHVLLNYLIGTEMETSQLFKRVFILSFTYLIGRILAYYLLYILLSEKKHDWE